jgi:hypothetical protein
MARTPEFVDDAITELQNDMQDLRGILYGDRRRNEASGLVQAVTHMAHMGEERDRRLQGIEGEIQSANESLARLENALAPIARQTRYQDINAISRTFGLIGLILWVIVATTPVLVSEWREKFFGAEPWLWFGVLVLAAGVFTGLSMATRRNGVHLDLKERD